MKEEPVLNDEVGCLQCLSRLILALIMVCLLAFIGLPRLLPSRYVDWFSGVLVLIAFFLMVAQLKIEKRLKFLAKTETRCRESMAVDEDEDDEE